jgi:hypothetical protein
MNEIGRYIRFTFRTLSRTPGPILAAILSLAIGIGANAALYSVVNGLLLKPLPYPDPDRLGLIWLHSPGLGIFQDWPSPGQFLDVKAQNRSFDDMAIMHGSAQTLTGGTESLRVRRLRTTPNLFTMLGATAMLGRLPGADDDLPGKPRVGVLSHGFSLAHEVVPTVGGVVLGLAGAFALTRVMRTLLFEVSPSDPMTFAAVPLLLSIVALAASYIPARRATRIEPLVALRDE